MKAVRASEGGVTVVDVEEPPGIGNEVLDMKSTSICASDLSYIAWGMRMLLGHELAGVRQNGTPVVVEALYGCGECERCLRGAYNLCFTHAERALGVSIDGGMAYHYRAPVGRLVPLPAGLHVGDACLVEPASVSWHALRLGVFMRPPQIDWMPLFRWEAELIPSLGYCSHDDGREMDHVAQMLADDPEIAKAIITHRFPIEDAVEAFRTASDRASGAIRVVIEP